MKSNLENLKNIFEKMQQEGFDVSKPLKWGFFFFDTKKEALINVFNELKEHQYKKELLKKTEDGKWKLYVSKIEILAMDKLYRRNVAFNELAEYCGVELYDGWDVEKVETKEQV